MIRNLMRVGIAAVLAALIATAPAMAAGMEERGGERREKASKLRFTTQDDVVLLDYFDGPTGKRLLGFIDPSDGTFSLHGLTIKSVGGPKGHREFVASWAGEEVVLPSAEAIQADAAFLLPFQTLVTGWAQGVDRRALEGLRSEMHDYLAATARSDDVHKQASCFWEGAQLVGAFLLALGACGSGILFACAGAFIMLMVQLNDTAEACGWCGFGQPC